MARSKGLEKMLGNYVDPKKAWRQRNPDQVSEINRLNFQKNKERIYAKRRETRATQAESKRRNPLF